MNSDVSAIKTAKVSEDSNEREKSIIEDLENDLRGFMITIYEETEVELQSYQHVNRHTTIWNKLSALIDRLFHY